MHDGFNYQLNNLLNHNHYLMLMGPKIKVDDSTSTWICKYKQDHKQQISDSSSQILENIKQYWDTPGLQHSNHISIGKEDGSILLNFPSYLV